MGQEDSSFSAPPSIKRQRRKSLSPARHSDSFLIRIPPENTSLFRYLLESAGSHLTMVKVLEPKTALFKLLFSPHQRSELICLLDGMKKTISFDYEDWLAPATTEKDS